MIRPPIAKWVRISRADVDAGRVRPLVIENGAVVPPGAQVNGFSLPEHQARNHARGWHELTYAQAMTLYGEEAALAYFEGNSHAD